MKLNVDQERYKRAKERMSKYLRRVRFDIDENDDVTGVSTISIVDKPAIGSEFVAFGSSEERLGNAAERRYQRAIQRMRKIQESWRLQFPGQRRV